jgi:hypothetical protein
MSNPANMITTNTTADNARVLNVCRLKAMVQYCTDFRFGLYKAIGRGKQKLYYNSSVQVSDTTMLTAALVLVKNVILLTTHIHYSLPQCLVHQLLRQIL